MIPYDNLSFARFTGLILRSFKKLKDVCAFISGEYEDYKIKTYFIKRILDNIGLNRVDENRNHNYPDFADIKEQKLAKRAILIAVFG